MGLTRSDHFYCIVGNMMSPGLQHLNIKDHNEDFIVSFLTLGTPTSYAYTVCAWCPLQGKP